MKHFSKSSFGQLLLFCLLLALLGFFILLPILQVVYVAFTKNGQISLIHFINFFKQPSLSEALWRSLFVGLAVVFFSSLISLPLALFTTRYDFKGRLMIQTLGVLPLVMPAFVGAIAMQTVLGRSGMVNQLLRLVLGTTVPFMEGLSGVILVQALHYFPFILLNASAALGNADPSLEEAGRNLGASGFRLFRQITFPLIRPGYIAGTLIVFIKSIDDLGTPLMLGYHNLLAPLAYQQITAVHGNSAMGYVISVILVTLSFISLWFALSYLNQSEYTQQRSANPVRREQLTGWQSGLISAFCVGLLGISLLPHLGIFLMSVAKFWSFTILPKSYTLDHYTKIFVDAPQLIKNTVLYALLAALIDVLLGSVIAFLLLRSKMIGRSVLDFVATLPLAVPGVVLAIGYLRIFHAVDLPILGQPLTETWIILVIAYAVRRLPYTLRSCYAILQQIHISLEEASQNLGAGPFTTFIKIALPLMLPGIIAGGVIAFITSSVELSSTLMLVPRNEMAPLSYGIYLYMQETAGRGPGASLGVIAILIVAVGTYAVNRLSSNRQTGGGFKI